MFYNQKHNHHQSAEYSVNNSHPLPKCYVDCWHTVFRPDPAIQDDIDVTLPCNYCDGNGFTLRIFVQPDRTKTIFCGTKCVSRVPVAPRLRRSDAIEHPIVANNSNMTTEGGDTVAAVQLYRPLHLDQSTVPVTCVQIAVLLGPWRRIVRLAL